MEIDSAEEETQMVKQNQGAELLSKLHHLYQNKQMCDVRLSVKGKLTLDVHGVVLTSFSSYFHNALPDQKVENASEIKTIECPGDIEGEVVEALVNFLYTGVLSLTSTSVWHLLSAATQLGMDTACQLCHEYFKRTAQKINCRQAEHISRATDVADPEKETNVSYSHDREMHSVPPKKRGRKPKYAEYENILKTNPDTSSSLGHIKSRQECLSTSSPPPCDEVVDDVIHEDPVPLPPFTNVSAPVLPARKSRRLQLRNDPVVANESEEPTSEIRRAKCDNTNGPSLKKKLLKERNPRSGKAKNQNVSHGPKESDFVTLHDRLHFGKVIAARYREFRVRSVSTRRSNKRYGCAAQNCKKTFKYYSSSIMHCGKAHVNSPVFKCSCSKTFRQFQKLRLHRASSPSCSMVKRIVCLACLRPFIHKKNLRLHEKSCPNALMKNNQSKVKINLRYKRRRNNLTCPGCTEEYRTTSQLKLHMIRVHKLPVTKATVRVKTKQVLDSQWICQEKKCKSKFGTYEQLLDHMQSDHSDVMYRCLIVNCPYQTPVLTMLERHSKIKHGSDKKCPHCGKEFKKRYFLRIHMHSKHGVDDPTLKIHTCPKEGCGYVTYQKNIMDKHVWRHTADKTFVCTVCDKKLKTKTNLEKHMKKVHLKVRPYVCEQCGANYGELSELKVHIQRHSTDKQFKCQHCEYESHDKGNFQSHLWAKHKIKLGAKVKLFKCKVCDYSCDRKTRFDQHMNSHMGIRQHKCPHCAQEFLSKSTMVAHIKWKHQEKTLKCDYCDYRSGSLNFLREHVRIQHTHRDIKPYKCAYCEYRCAVSGNCRKHVMSRHKGLPVKWEKVCDKWGPGHQKPLLGVEKAMLGSTSTNMDMFNQSIDRIIAGDSTESRQTVAHVVRETVGEAPLPVKQQITVTNEVEIPNTSYQNMYQVVSSQGHNVLAQVLPPSGIRQQQQQQHQQQQHQQPKSVIVTEGQEQNQLIFPAVYTTDPLVIPGQHDYTQNVSFYQMQ